MKRHVQIGNKCIGPGQPVYIVAEIGINHNGDLSLTKKLIDVAAVAGIDAVKFQKREPDICVPEEQKGTMRDTPWGPMTYLEYRYKMEFDRSQYEEIDEYCRNKGVAWFTSCWDISSVNFIEDFKPVCYKIASASLTDNELIDYLDQKKRPIILSTGMSTWEQIKQAVDRIKLSPLIITHNTSTYPCPPKELNLRMIQTLQRYFGGPVGYSGHEVGLQTSYAAVALGASLIERHITLDRHMWGSDQMASVESTGIFRLVRDIRIIEQALGDGVKQVYESELPNMKKLRCN